MKRLPWILLACCALLCGYASNEFIRWTLAGKPIVEITVNGEPKVQFGLRQDGVVVWREITHMTNSPAEKPYQFDTQQWFLTNATLTNIVILDDLIRTK